jgi:hypothetical protein
MAIAKCLQGKYSENIFAIIIILLLLLLQIDSFLYFVCVPFTHAHLVFGPRAVELAWK